MRELCESTGIKFASPPLADNWGNTSVNTVFDGGMLPHADETKKL